MYTRPPKWRVIDPRSRVHTVEATSAPQAALIVASRLDWPGIHEVRKADRLKQAERWNCRHNERGREGWAAHLISTGGTARKPGKLLVGFS